MANNGVPVQTAPIGAVCSGSTLFASILNSSVMLGNYLQQTTSADDIFRYIFPGALRVNSFKLNGVSHSYQMDQSISVLTVVGWYFHFYSSFNRTLYKQTVETLTVLK